MGQMTNLRIVPKKIYVVTGLVILLTVGYAFAAAKIPLFRILRESTADLLVRQRHLIAPLPAAIKDITIVTIDEESLKRLRQRWPMSRGIYAALLRKLSPEGAKPSAIGMDLFFSGPSEIPEDDFLLAEALKKSVKTVIASYVSQTGTIIVPEDMLARSAAGVGFVSAPRDHDLVVRETYPAMRLTGGSFVYSFPLLTYAEGRGIEVRDGMWGIPLDPVSGTVRINYFANLEDFKTIPLWEALVTPEAESLFNDKIVLVGTIMEMHHDVYPTPLGIMPGVAINANILMNLMSGRWAVPLSPWIMFPALLFGALAVSGATYRFGVLKGAAAGACLAGGAFLLASAGIRYDLMFDLFGFVLMVTAAFTGVSIWMGLSALIENTKLNSLAMTDGLTGAFTYRYFELILEREAALVRGKRALLSLAIFDIDKFKNINDTYGHGAGNDVLRGVVAAIKDLVPAHGVVARFGGDEFVAVLPGVHSEEAREIASGIIKAARTLAFVWLPKDAVITVSAGVVTTKSSTGSTGKDLIKAADAELYKAKASGKNRVSAGAA